jgi:hypothetical protein
MEALPSSNSTLPNQALEDQVTDLFKLSALRNSMTKEQFEATPFGDSVKKILHLIEGVMMPKVIEAHDANQKELDKLAADVTKCGATKNSQIEKANTKKVLYLKFSPLHKTCRAGEAGAYTEKSTCWEEEADKKKIKDLKCSAFAMVRKQTGDQTANKQIMKKGGSESTESYVNRISMTICGKCAGKGCNLFGERKAVDAAGGEIEAAKEKKCGYDPYTCGCGFQCRFDKAKDACVAATHEHDKQVRKCKVADKQYNDKKAECDSLQDQMDDSACKRAVMTKDACESYEECYFDKKKAYSSLEKMVKSEETDRKAEWKGLKRMKCLIKAFANKKVTNDDISTCKKKTHSTDHLIIKYPELPKLVKCSVPDMYPNTPPYKKVNFAPLPALAKGKQDVFECTGLQEISTTPAVGSPKTCKCSRVTMNGPYSPGPVVKCVNCLDVRRSLEKNSCPDGTKLFAPRSKTDWKTFLNSATPLRAPNFIIDVTRPQNGKQSNKRYPMNSDVPQQNSWVTSDGTPWFLRDRRYSEPSGDYQANCYMDLWKPAKDENSVTFNDGRCNYHSKSYYCQSEQVALTPKKGSPSGCVCKLVALTGRYSAGSLIRCDGCLRVSRSTQKNSCPMGTKLFSPRTRSDWATFIASATPLRSPNWIIDITQPQNGCGGCTRNAMNSRNPAQATWRTTDGTPWFLRASKYSEPNGDYYANCYLDLGTTANENTVTFNDHKCAYNSNAYYCQTAKAKRKPPPPPPPAEPEGPPEPKAGGRYEGYKCDGGAYTGLTKECDHFTNLTETQCWEKCQNSSSAMGKQSCDKVTGLPDCVASVYHKKLKICMLHRGCRKLKEWNGHPDIVTRIKEDYNPSARVFKTVKFAKCKGTPYTRKGKDKLGMKKTTWTQCLRACRVHAFIRKSVPQKRCAAIVFYPKKAKGKKAKKSLKSILKRNPFKGHRRRRRARKTTKKKKAVPTGYCDLFDKCDVPDLEKSKTAQSFVRIPRETKDAKKSKKKQDSKKGDNDEDEEE